MGLGQETIQGKNNVQSLNFALKIFRIHLTGTQCQWIQRSQKMSDKREIIFGTRHVGNYQFNVWKEINSFKMSSL